jgi:hypothetical protein
MKITICHCVTLCNLVGHYQYFGGPAAFIFRVEECVPLSSYKLCSCADYSFALKTEASDSSETLVIIYTI